MKLQEAMALRDGGLRKPVLLMGPFDEKNLEEMVARDVMPMVYTPVGPLNWTGLRRDASGACRSTSASIPALGGWVCRSVRRRR